MLHNQGACTHTRTLGTTSNELFQKTNLALLCEDVLNGMIAANEYHAPSQDETSSIPPKDIASLIHAQIQQPNRAPLDIIIDIENRAWEFWIQGGTNYSNYDLSCIF